MSKFFITGGAGFIGSHITKKLLEQGHSVVCYDAFIQYISPLESLYQIYLKERFKDIKDKITFIRGDTRSKFDIRRAILETKPDIIIHLAALPIADLSNKHSEEALSSILQGAVNALEVVRDVDFVKRFVYASSSMIYGDFEYRPCDEEHPKRPKDMYGGTKYAGEILVETFGRRYGIEYSIVRPSAVYGPTDVNRRVSQIFVENALKGKTLYLHGGGERALDFTFVEDTAQGFILAATHPQAANEVFNITYGQGRTLAEFVDIIKQKIPEVKVEISKADVFRPNRGALDITKAKKLLGYAPQYPLEKGLAIYIDYVKQFVEKGLI